MKKSLFIVPLLLSVLSLNGCQDQKVMKNVFLPFGKLYDSSLEIDDISSLNKAVKNITHSELSSLIDKKENFLLLVYKPNTCVCYETFARSLLKYLSLNNTLLYGISPTEFDGGHDVFGLKINQNEQTLAIFDNGTLLHQKTTQGEDDEFVIYKNLSAWLHERVHSSDMLYVNEAQLDSLFLGDSQFTVGFLKESCGDCAYVTTHVLKDYNEKDNNISYVIDCDAFEDDSYKDKYGLSSSSNPDYGYGVGYVPTFITYYPTIGNKNEAIVDAITYLNDEISYENNEYVIKKSYFSQEREDLLGFLGNSKVTTTVLEGMKIPAGQIENKDGKYYWKKEEAAKYHNPLLLSFLDAYISIK